jgi:polysaccharide deacetylase family protein (PEP-CTERM system associated)
VNATDPSTGAGRAAGSNGFQRFPAALSVDLEDYYHPELIRRHSPPGAAFQSRVEASTLPLLDLIEHHGVKATFFIVGEVIRPAARIIERIARGGHEIGCHTHSHRPLWELSPDSFREELRSFRRDLREVAGNVEVRGFRAPTFSVDSRTAWALRVLEEEGYTYDSSIVPARGPLYGCPGAPRGIYRPAALDLTRDDPAGRIVEFPAPVTSLAGARLPMGGGIYLRVLPFPLYERFVRGILSARPFFLYVHPWETDPEIPRVDLPAFSRWATYSGMKGMLRKVEKLLTRIRFTTMRSVLRSSGYAV